MASVVSYLSVCLPACLLFKEHVKGFPDTRSLSKDDRVCMCERVDGEDTVTFSSFSPHLDSGKSRGPLNLGGRYEKVDFSMRE